MMKLVTKRNVCRKTMANAIRLHLAMKSYTRIKKKHPDRENHCNPPSKQFQTVESLNTMEVMSGSLLMNRNSWLHEVVNRKNSRIIVRNPSEVPPVMKSKHPASSMVFGAVASDGRVMPLISLKLD